jgi:hypothetical protein
MASTLLSKKKDSYIINNESNDLMKLSRDQRREQLQRNNESKKIQGTYQVINDIETPKQGHKYLGKELCPGALDEKLKDPSDIYQLERACSPDEYDLTNISRLIKIIYSKIRIDSDLDNLEMSELVKLKYATRVLGLFIKNEFNNNLKAIAEKYPSMSFENLIKIYNTVTDNNFNLKEYNILKKQISKYKTDSQTPRTFFGQIGDSTTLGKFLGTIIKNIIERDYNDITNKDIIELQLDREYEYCTNYKRVNNTRTDIDCGIKNVTQAGGKRRSKKGSKSHKGGKRSSKKLSKKGSKKSSKKGGKKY